MPPTPLPRIAYLITNSEIGGAQSHVADLLAGLAGRVDAIVLAGGDGPLFDAARKAGAATVKLARLDNRLSPWRAVVALRELMRALRAARPDLIHAHSAKGGALGRVAGWLLGIPVVYTVHGFGFKSAAPTRQRIASRLVEWTLAPITARMICVAEAERTLSQTLPIDAARVTVVRNGIADHPARAAPDAPLRRMVMVARFAAPKRHDLLIQAFARAGLPDCELVLAGDGPGRAAARALADSLAPGKVSFPGNVGDIPALLASAQVFVLASDHEGFPLSVLEAMRAGLAVVGTDLPGIREQLDNGRCGMLIPVDGADALADALTTLSEIPGGAARRGDAGRAARQRWQESFGLDAMVQGTWAVYRAALSEAQPDNARNAGAQTRRMR